MADILGSNLESLVNKNLFRRPKTIDAAQGVRIKIAGRELVNFSSNDYLGLANDPRLIECFKKACDKYGIGSGASPLVCGRSHAHEELELALAKFACRDRAISFSSGYLANLSLATALCPGREGLVVLDRLCHASIIDGGLLSRAQLKRYPHADAGALNDVLSGADNSPKLVLTDGVFSMDGDIAPCAKLAEVCANNDAWLAVDDAHGFGVLGRNGGGSLELANLSQKQVPILIATFGKALGASGAFIAGSETLIETLKQKARPYIYSTAMLPALASTVTESLSLVKNESWRRDRLFAVIDRFKCGAESRGLDIIPSNTPIQPMLLGSAEKAQSASEGLLKKGILVVAIRPPTVPANSSRLRITLSSSHSDEDVDQLLFALDESR